MLHQHSSRDALAYIIFPSQGERGLVSSVRTKPDAGIKFWIQFGLAVALLPLFISFPASAKRLRPPAEVVPKPDKPELQVGALRLHRCKDAPAYCGQLPRKLDARGVVAGEIQIGFQFYPHLDQSRAPLEPIVAMEGGPGYPTTQTRHSYLALFRPLMEHRDLLLVDNRGTGLSEAVNCPSLQREPNPALEGIKECGATMGSAAYLYGTVAAADDLAAVLDALSIPLANLYGDSYATYFSQTFATRHPERLRSLVLDSAYPVVGLSPWYPEIAPTSKQAFDNACRRSRTCSELPGDSSARIWELVQRLREHPFSGRARDGDGGVRQVTANPTGIAFLMYGNSTASVVYRELDAAARAYMERDDRLPLLRLLAESKQMGETGGQDVSFRHYSAAIFVAVSCTDYPQIYDMKSTPDERRTQRTRAFAEKQSSDPDVYAPFTIEEFDALPLDTSVLSLCVDWPQAPAGFQASQPVAPGTPFPKIPVLVMTADLDTLTPEPQATNAAALFPNAREVIVQNSFHVTALQNPDDCASKIVRRFVGELDPGDSSCAQHIAEIHLVQKFAGRAQELDQVPGSVGNQAKPEDLRIVAAAYTVGDALERWWVNNSGKGVGLRGGSFRYRTSGSHSLYKFKKLRWVEDVEVSGEADWDYNFPGPVKARVKVRSGKESGALEMRWNDLTPDAQAQITGKMGKRSVAATVYAPF
jgi:pimeloyl-ACP methyl ester carboxylesterase